jgi:hypothetical protein
MSERLNAPCKVCGYEVVLKCDRAGCPYKTPTPEGKPTMTVDHPCTETHEGGMGCDPAFPCYTDPSKCIRRLSPLK